MSLETNLQLNNELVAKNNELLTRLIQSLSAGVALHPETTAKVQEYRETATETKPESAVICPVTLDELDFSGVIALAGFYPEPVELSDTMIQRALDYQDAEGAARVVQIDALDTALQGVKRAAEVHKTVLLELARTVVSFWDDLPAISDRRGFAEKWLDAKPGERDAVKPKKAKQQKTEERPGPFFYKNADGTKFGEVTQLRKLEEVTGKGFVEINKVEYLQLKEAAEKASETTASDTGADEQPDFAALRKQAEGLILQLAKGGYRAEAVAILEKQGAKKLGEVADDSLADVIAQAEKALEG